MTFAFQLSHRSWGWVSADYRPSNSSVMYPGPGMSPAVSLYALTAGLSRTFGLPFAPARWRPFELGLGAGATQAQFETRAYQGTGGTGLPPDAQFEDVASSGLLSSSRWRPTATARLRVACPSAAPSA